MYNCYGLTGGIASGKSTVALYLAELDVPVIDADALYHNLIRPIDGGPSPVALAIGQTFSQVLRSDGSIDRPALAAEIFADASQRSKLEAITHPAVRAAAATALAALHQAGHKLIFYDVPLLYERDLATHFLGVAVVWVSRAQQLERLIKRSQLTAAQAQARLAAQLSLDQKRDRAAWVIDNSGSLQQTRAQVEHMVVQLRTKTR